MATCAAVARAELTLVEAVREGHARVSGDGRLAKLLRAD